MLTSLDKFDHAAVVGSCARRAEISVALPPKGDSYLLRHITCMSSFSLLRDVTSTLMVVKGWLGIEGRLSTANLKK
jgi:hypothetical protein